jgi:ABC-2 type transport system ATP-binding protein
MAGSLLSVQGLVKRYGPVVAVRDLALEVPPGAFCGFFGPNGSGKTTTLDIVAGLRPRDAGRISMFGVPFDNEWPPGVKLRFAYVAPQIRFLNWMGVGEHVEFLAGFYPSWDRALETELRELTRLPYDKRVGGLSPGEHIQLQMLVALARHPDLLLIDEPGNLDVRVRHALMEAVVSAVAQDGLTVVIASHILSELEGLCDHACIIDSGRTLAQVHLGETLGPTAVIEFPTTEPARVAEATAGLDVTRLNRGDRMLLVLPEASGEEVDAVTHRLGVPCEVEYLPLQDLFLRLTDPREPAPEVAAR